jgi:transcriptional regulator with XRE-family HTH domain
MGRQRQRLIDRREDLGLTREQVADALGINPKTYARCEQGKTMLRVGQRPQLARLLNWSPAELRVALNDDGSAPTPGRQTVPQWLTLYASLEQAASQLWTFQPMTVPALLQTRDYAAAVERIAPRPVTDEDVAQRVEARMARQGVLSREPDPLHLSVVLDESVLWRVTGGRRVMVDQLRHLADMGERPNVDIHVLPLDAGVHSAAFGGFIVLASSGAAEPQMVCVEDRTGIRYLEGPHAVDAHIEVFQHLRDFALPGDESLDVVRTVAKETNSDSDRSSRMAQVHVQRPER